MCSKGSKMKPSFNLLKELNPSVGKKTEKNEQDEQNGKIRKTKVKFADENENENEKSEIKNEQNEIINENQNEAKNKNKKIRIKSEKEIQENEENEEKEKNKKRISGLESTVRELLANYKPYSKEGIPFYCRICRIQSDDIDTYNEHNVCELHLLAVNIEKQMSYCKLCRKQFTSPEQLKEHVSGKNHKQHFAKIKSKQNIQKNMSRI